ncbi:hypothetical protein NDU88_005448 [Pleurodeles waltl]|uniref:Retrotransposon gag domain-containing protein n=1 Tax=Pleurodeles waltl TaxID=8319 RepID=A0AAV7NMG3_PLEWA|nr:hypothetical protein NDU88_005448 [Pleurodeles waltl]
MRRRPMLLHLWGSAIHKLGRSVVEEGPPFNYQSLKRALTTHFEPLVNPDYEHFFLRQARQLPNESIDTFYARLKDLAHKGCAFVKLQENILQVPGMSMVNILTMGRSKELPKVHAAYMDAALQTQVKSELVNAISASVTEKKKVGSRLLRALDLAS